MKFDPDGLSEFARYYGFHYNRLDPFGLVEDALVEMEQGLKGAPSSLPMLPSYIGALPKIKPGRTVIAMDAGGTNLRSALVKFDENGKEVVLESMKVPMPGTKGQLSAEAFFDEIAAVTAPLIEKAGDSIEGIGFCFSYHIEITSEADGILKSFSKEVDAPEVIGRAIGAGLREALIRRKVKVPARIVLLNDTVATLLSGLLQMQGEGPVVGFILGTGFNTAYPEKSIPKIGFASADRPQIVVCESGNFAHRYMGILDTEYDKGTKNPGTYSLEKATSGAYLGPLTSHIIKRALNDGLFSFEKSAEFLSWPSMQTRELNEFMHEPFNKSNPIACLFNDNERDALSSFIYLTSMVTERGALLSASVLAAAMEKAGGGSNPFVPVRAAVEGTTYMIYKGMRRSLESCLHLILNKRMLRSYSVSPVEQASLLGAAVAALD